MEKESAWENFCKTGSIESFLEYKKIESGENSSGTNKTEGNNNKGDSIQR